MSHDPIAYTYNGDVHCPDCAADKYGQCRCHGRIAMMTITDDNLQGQCCTPSLDDENNEVHVIAPWDESTCGLWCGTCGEEIEPHPILDMFECCSECGEERLPEDDDERMEAWENMYSGNAYLDAHNKAFSYRWKQREAILTAMTHISNMNSDYHILEHIRDLLDSRLPRD
jgi:hypothetical protein